MVDKRARGASPVRQQADGPGTTHQAGSAHAHLCQLKARVGASLSLFRKPPHDLGVAMPAKYVFIEAVVTTSLQQTNSSTGKVQPNKAANFVQSGYVQFPMMSSSRVAMSSSL
jgi:hypothetical protein